MKISPPPYPGLRPFRQDESELFFGREEHVFGILEKLGKSNFVAVTGQSGCGKTSLVNAGVLPALKLGLLKDTGEEWRIVEMRPGNRPMRNLSKSLLEPESTTDPSSVAFLLATLKKGRWGLVSALKEKPLPKGTNLLILVDQFEEIFRYRQQHIDEAEAFVDLILASAQQDDLPIYVIITMRSDFMGECSFFLGLPEQINRSQFLTPRLDREQLQAAIDGPVNRRIERNLVTGLLNDMGSKPDQLPLMQHVLMRMWMEAVKEHGEVFLTLEDYKKIGRLEQSLSNHAEEAYGELDKAQQEIAKTLFCCLTERSVRHDEIRRPVSLSEITRVAGAELEKVKEVVEVFRRPDRSFLTPSARISLTSDKIVDISHESLIRQWKRLKEWVEEEAESAGIYRRLEQTAHLWKDGKAALWGTPDLENALHWKKLHDPKPEWAERYGSDFQLAMDFLDESEKKRDENKKKEEQARQNELIKTRLFATVVSFVMLIAVFLAIWGFNEKKQRTEILFDSCIIHASLQAKLEDYAEARKILRKSSLLDSDISPERRHARNLVAWFADLMGGTGEQVYKGEPLLDIAVNPDGSLLAGVGKRIVMLFDTKEGKLLERLERHTGNVREAAFHPKGNWLATADDHYNIILWTIPDGKILKEWYTPGRALAVSKNGSQLASGGIDNNVTIWNVEKPEFEKKLEGHKDSINALAFSHDGHLLVSTSDDNTAIVWNLETGQIVHRFGREQNKVENIAIHPSGKILATVGSDNDILLWDMESGKLKTVLQGHKDVVSDLAYDHSGNYLISASLDHTLRIWDTYNNICLKVLQGHEAGVTSLAVVDNYIFSTGSNGILRRWNINVELPVKIELPDKAISSAICPDGSKVAVGLHGGSLCLYNLPDAQLLWEKPEAHSNQISRLAFSPDGKLLASASHDDLVKLWQVSNGDIEQTFRGHKDSVCAVDFSPNGKFIATASYDGQIGLFEIGRENGQFQEAHEGEVHSIAFDARGQKLISAGEDGKTRLWNINKTWPPGLVRDFPKSDEMVMWADFSPDGTNIASVGKDRMVHIMNDSGEPQTLIGHKKTVYRVIFSPDSKQVATVSGDASLRFWDMKDGAELFTLRLPADSGYPVPLWDFDFRCAPEFGGNCWISVPLTKGMLVLYNLGQIYNN